MKVKYVKSTTLHILLMGMSIPLWSQTKENNVPKIEIKYHIMAKAYEDSVVLRFAPTSPNALPAHIEKGISLDQKIVSGKFPYKTGDWSRINSDTIRPWPLNSFNTEEYKKNKDMLLVAQALYGNIPSSKTDEIAKVKEQAEALSNLFYLSLLAADYDAMAANSYGLRYVIKTKIKPDEKLFFRIYNNFSHPLFKVDTTMTFTTYGEWDAPNAPNFLSVENKEKAVELKWPVNKELYRWSGFFIEKSEDGVNFVRVNKKPYLVFRNDTKYDATYVDSLQQNYKKYYYRIQAIDPFGDLSGYSNMVKGMGVDLTAPGQLTLVEQSENGNGITLSWSFLDRSPSDLKHFIIQKGNYVNSIADSITTIKPGTYNYYYPEKAKIRSTYFEVHAVDTAGNVRVSNPVRYFLPDTDPPLPPKGFKAHIDTSGMVTLNWKQDTLDELIGYRVYRKNKENHKYVCLQEGYLADTIYHDTLNLKTLTDEVYYAVSAIDLSYNHGKMSAFIKLIKPDILPPYPPNIVDYHLADGKVYITWTPSPSEDVVSYNINRKNNSTQQTLMVKNITIGEENNFTDTGLKNGEMYEYSLTSIDDVGLHSDPSFPLTIRAYSNKIIEDITLKIIVEKESTGIQWTSPKTSPLYYIIYRDTGKGMQQFANAKNDETKFFDSKYSDAKNYGIQAIYPNQIKSEIFTLHKI